MGTQTSRHHHCSPVNKNCNTNTDTPPLFAPKQIIRNASIGAVDAILTFAADNGKTLALSACAAHLVDLLYRADRPAVANSQRCWYLQRLAERLKAFPAGGWELAATYVEAAIGNGVDNDVDDATVARDAQKRADALWDVALGVKPSSERATHELVEWCRVNGLGELAAEAVCRARGAAWLRCTGFPPEAVEPDASLKAEKIGEAVGIGGRSEFVRGACGKAAYWLARGSDSVRLERLCAEVAERLMLAIPSKQATIDTHEVRVIEPHSCVINK